MTDTKKMKIEFAPGVLEGLEAEMDPEDLQDLMNKIKDVIEGGDLENLATPVDMDELKLENPDLYNTLQERLINPVIPKRILH